MQLSISLQNSFSDHITKLILYKTDIVLHVNKVNLAVEKTYMYTEQKQLSQLRFELI